MIMLRVPPVAVLADAVVAAGSIEAERAARAGRGGGVRARGQGALVHVALAARASEPGLARAALRC